MVMVICNDNLVCFSVVYKLNVRVYSMVYTLWVYRITTESTVRLRCIHPDDAVTSVSAGYHLL